MKGEVLRNTMNSKGFGAFPVLGGVHFWAFFWSPEREGGGLFPSRQDRPNLGNPARILKIGRGGLYWGGGGIVYCVDRKAKEGKGRIKKPKKLKKNKKKKKTTKSKKK